MAAPVPFIGLTGAIASGKTEATRALARLGAATLSTDEVAHGILDEPDVRRQIVERWGDSVVTDEVADRDAVGAIVFSDPDELRWLESVTHPMVGRKVVEWREALDPGTSLAVVEVPLLFEAGMEAFFDGVLVVVAGKRRAGWLRARGDLETEGRSGRQMTEAEKSERATWVVDNDGTIADLEASLQRLWPELTQGSRGEPA